MVEGLPMLKNEKVACDGCALGKMHIDEFPSVITEISSAQGDKNSASSTQKNSHSWHKD